MSADTKPMVLLADDQADVREALRLLLGEHKQPMLLVVSGQGKMQGLVTKTDILHALKTRHEENLSASAVNQQTQVAQLEEAVRVPQPR